MRSAALVGVLRAALLLVVALLTLCTRVTPVAADDTIDVVLFHGQGCPHCDTVKELLERTQQREPRVHVQALEIYFDHDNARTFQRLADAYHVEVQGVPTVFVGEEAISGASPEAQASIAQTIDACLRTGCSSPLDRISSGAAARPLTFSAVVLGALVDAINPCAFAVLVILITAVLAAGNRRKALLAGLAFSASIFISYYLMGLGLFSVAAATGVTQTLYVAVTVVAIVMGLLNLKDYFWYGKWFITEVPQKWRPTLKKTLGKVTSVPGAFLIGFIVSLFLLPCTSGPYIVILGLLAKTATRQSALLWLVLYNVVFVSPMVAITLAVHRGMTTVERAEQWRTKHLRQLHLVAGIILLALGVAMIVSSWFGKL